jgi:hypothetical protein
MSERRFEVSDPRPGDSDLAMMSEDELRQTYAFLVDVIDLEGFRQAVVVANGTRIEVNEVFDLPNQHTLPQ